MLMVLCGGTHMNANKAACLSQPQALATSNAPLKVELIALDASSWQPSTTESKVQERRGMRMPL